LEGGEERQTDRAETRSSVSSVELENLPVPIGRNYQNLLVTVPGVMPPANQHSVAANPSRGLTFNVNGATRNSNNVRIDAFTDAFVARLGDFPPAQLLHVQAEQKSDVDLKAAFSR